MLAKQERLICWLADAASSANTIAMDDATDGLSHPTTVTALEHCVHLDLPSCDGLL
jgi:hypothetical protein